MKEMVTSINFSTPKRKHVHVVKFKETKWDNVFKVMGMSFLWTCICIIRHYMTNHDTRKMIYYNSLLYIPSFLLRMYIHDTKKLANRLLKYLERIAQKHGKGNTFSNKRCVTLLDKWYITFLDKWYASLLGIQYV